MLEEEQSWEHEKCVDMALAVPFTETKGQSPTLKSLFFYLAYLSVAHLLLFQFTWVERLWNM